MGIKNSKKNLVFLLGFIVVEVVLYALILGVSGDFLVISSFAAIVLCFVYAVVNLKRSGVFVAVGLACTAIADVFLVICSPIQRLWGMIFFLITQGMYAIKLQLESRNKKYCY